MPLGQADRGDRDPPDADAQPVAAGGHGQGRQQGVEVQQRLAHAHHHHVAEPLLPAGPEQPLELQHLLEDFAGGEVADHAVDARGAEHAAHRAADLRADADGAVLLVVAEQHALDPLGVVQFQEQLFRAVGGLAVLGDLRGPDLKLGGKLLAESAGRSVISSNAAARF